MEKKYTWLYGRRPNSVTDDPSDFIATVIITDSMTNEDIAQQVVKRGTVFDFPTLLNAFQLRDQVILDFLSQGLAVVTGTCQYQPTITGTLDGTAFDPNRNRCNVNITPSVEMRRMLTNVRAEYSGATQLIGGSEISKIEDATTGLKDGTVTPGGIVNIWGNKIKIVKDDGTTTGAIVFEAEDGTKTAVNTALGANEKGHLSFIVPALADGNYTLRITTKYTSNPIKLKEERTIVFPILIKVGNSGGGEGGGDDVLE